jgi:hypothetical protein
MTKEQLYQRFKLEDYFYYHSKPDYEYNGFIFKQNEYYKVTQDEGGIWFYDDDGNSYDAYDMDSTKLSKL